MFYEEDEFEDEGPSEGDWVTTDHSNFREHNGRGSFTVNKNASESTMWRAIKNRMKADKFWPNVWFLSDHGNYHLMTPPKRKRR